MASTAIGIILKQSEMTDSEQQLAILNQMPEIMRLFLSAEHLTVRMNSVCRLLGEVSQTSGAAAAIWETDPAGVWTLRPIGCWIKKDGRTQGSPGAEPLTAADRARFQAWSGELADRESLFVDEPAACRSLEKLFSGQIEVPAAVITRFVVDDRPWGFLVQVVADLAEAAGVAPAQALVTRQLSLLLEKKFSGTVIQSNRAEENGYYTRLQVNELQNFFDVAISITGVFDERQLIDRLYDQIKQILNPDIFIATLVDTAEEKLTIIIADEKGAPLRDGAPVLFPHPDIGISGWMIENRKPIFIRDLEQEPPPVPPLMIGAEKPRTWLGVPLVAYNRLIGTIAVQSFQPDAFDAYHRQLMDLLSRQVATAIAGARIFQAEARRRQEAEILHRLTSQLLDVGDDTAIFDIGIATVRKYLPSASAVSFSLLDKEHTRITIFRSWVSDPSFATLISPQEIPLDRLIITREVIEQGGSVFRENIAAEPFPSGSRLDDLVSNGLKSLLYVPLKLKSRILGVLHIGFWEEPRRFSPSEVMTCESIANRIAVSLQAYRLQKAEREKLKLARTLQEMGAILTIDLPLPKLLDRVFDLLSRVVDFDTATIQLHDEGTQSLYLAASRGFERTDHIEELFSQQGMHSLDKFENGSRIRIISDTHEDKNWVSFLGGETSNVRSWVGAQLVIKGRFIGILNIDSTSPHAFDHEIAETVLAFANQAAVAIEGARVYDILTQRVNQLSVLHQVAIDSSITFNSKDLVGIITQRITESIYQCCFGIFLLDKDGQHILLDKEKHSRFGEVYGDRIRADKGIIGHVFETGKPYVVHNVFKDPYYLPINEKTLSEIAVPIMIDGRVIGIINVESPKMRRFGEEDVSFLSTLASLISTTIQRVELYDEIQRYTVQLSDMVKQRTLELQGERDRLGAILRSAGEGILFTGPDGSILYANQALLQQTGYSEEELLGKNPRLLASGLVSPAVYEELWTTIKSGNRWHGELINRHKNGMLYDISLTITPLYDEEEKLNGFISVQSDITKLKELERLKSEFVTNVSHELRTPLTNIKTYITLLQRGRPEKRERYFEILELETERLTHLIQDLLDLSRLETEKTEIKLVQCDLCRAMRQTVTSFEQLINQGKVTLIEDFPPSLPLVWADPEKIQQVLTNLLGNAIAYTPAGGTIRFAAGATDDRVWIKLSDTGYGIGPDEMQRLFDRFYRGQASEISRNTGSGLGLSISKEIIDQHRGTIEIESELDEGSAFTVWLPISKS